MAKSTLNVSVTNLALENESKSQSGCGKDHVAECHTQGQLGAVLCLAKD